MQRISARPCVQGEKVGLVVREGKARLTDAAGLLGLRKVWDDLGIGAYLEAEAGRGTEQYRVSTIVEQWCALLYYGGGRLDDVDWLSGRGVKELFGWAKIPDPTTIGRWLRRRATEKRVAVEKALRCAVLKRWRAVGVPKAVMLILDSTVVLRYGAKQAGAVPGYNPKKPGRPSHHPLVAFLSTGDCLGVQWRAGNAHTAAGAKEWLSELVEWLRAAGVEDITIRLDRGFFAREMADHLQSLNVKFVLKSQEGEVMRKRKGEFVQSQQNSRFWSAQGESWGYALLSVQERNELGAATGELDLGAYEIVRVATMLTNIEGMDAFAAWNLYNQGAVVEHRIEELMQLSVGQTAIDDLEGNALLWAMGALAYQLLHVMRTRHLPEKWQTAQPKRLRAWLFRMPARLVRHARQWTVQLTRSEPMRGVLAFMLGDGVATPQTKLAM